MPAKAKTPCRRIGCIVLLDTAGYCSQHQRANYKAQKQTVTDDYKERNRFYQRKAWKHLRASQLAHEPLCRACRLQGRLIAAQVVDHIEPISQGGAPLSAGNLQSLCLAHHAEKSLKERS